MSTAEWREGPARDATTERQTIEVVAVTPAIAEPLSVFLRTAWGDTRSPEEVRLGLARTAAENPSVPGVEPPATAYLLDGNVIGYIGTIPVDFWNGKAEIQGHWLKGFMVLEAYRSGPVGFGVLKELLKHVGVSGIITVAPPARRLFTAVGYKDCGVLPNHISPLRAGRIARSLDIAGLGLGLPVWLDRTARLAQRAGLATLGGGALGLVFSTVRLVRGRSTGMRVEASGALPSKAELDALWAEARTTFAAGAVRDGRFLSWRYAPAPGGTYEAAVVRDRGNVSRVAAVSVVRRPNESSDPRLRGIKVASLSDILFRADEPAAGLAAIAGAERIARRMGADALLCTASHPAIERVLKRRAYLRLPGNVHLMIRDPKGAAELPMDATSWGATRGDASSDEVF
jgi:hypothetical protein